MAAISFFTEDITFVLPQKRRVSSWLKTTIETENFILHQLNIVFCSDAYLLTINKEYLQHDYYTDIITFTQTDTSSTIEGDIYISIDRVKENATIYHTTFLNELHRVMVHGVLHLCGYDDDNPQAKEVMRNKENHYLSLFTV